MTQSDNDKVIGRGQCDAEINRITWALKERVKELDCLFAIAKIIETPGISLGEILQKVVLIMPTAWQYPEITCARIVFNQSEYKTDNFRETEWRLAAELNLLGAKAGLIEIRYLEARPEMAEGPFLVEERKLIDAIAERLSRVIERRRLEAALREKMEEYKLISEAAIGRELKLIELEREIEKLKGAKNG